MDSQANKRDFAEFKRRIGSFGIPTTNSAYNRWGGATNAVANNFTLDEIIDIINSGDIPAMRELSRYYMRTNGIYRNAVLLMANLPRYDTVVIPIFNSGNKKVNMEQLLKKFDAACALIDHLNARVTFSEISTSALVSGIYYGILREEGDKITVQELPVEYCRTRFKDFNGLNVLEFNTRYFSSITEEATRKAVLRQFPKEIRQAFNDGQDWVMFGPELGGMCFTYYDHTPLFISAIPDLYKLDDAVDREAKRDENELYKLLIQKMPIDSKGELVFQLEEVADIHESVAQMLSSTDTVDVLTTFGDTSLEDLQGTTAASQSSNRIEKYTNNAYNNIGISELYFNPSTSSSMPYSIAKDEAFMRYLTEQYAAWVRVYLNRKFAQKTFSFSFSILPTTIFNYRDVQKQYFQGAQYGYSKIYAGVALGIKQTDTLSLINFENEVLNMTDKMRPLQSSYTSSGKTENNTAKASEISDNIEGGRPSLAVEARAEQTQKNIDAQ